MKGKEERELMILRFVISNLLIRTLGLTPKTFKRSLKGQRSKGKQDLFQDLGFSGNGFKKDCLVEKRTWCECMNRSNSEKLLGSSKWDAKRKKCGQENQKWLFYNFIKFFYTKKLKNKFSKKIYI